MSDGTAHNPVDYSSGPVSPKVNPGDLPLYDSYTDGFYGFPLAERAALANLFFREPMAQAEELMIFPSVFQEMSKIEERNTNVFLTLFNLFLCLMDSFTYNIVPGANNPILKADTHEALTKDLEKIFLPLGASLASINDNEAWMLFKTVWVLPPQLLIDTLLDTKTQRANLMDQLKDRQRMELGLNREQEENLCHIFLEAYIRPLFSPIQQYDDGELLSSYLGFLIETLDLVSKIDQNQIFFRTLFGTFFKITTTGLRADVYSDMAVGIMNLAQFLNNEALENYLELPWVEKEEQELAATE